MPPVHIFAADYTPSRSWELLDWCRSSGAEEFGISFLQTGRRPAPLVDEVLTSLNPHSIGLARRPSLSADSTGAFVFERERWTLNDATAAVLRHFLPAGLFTTPTYAEHGWLEDPVLYRSGDLFLGVVSHEAEGIMHLTELEGVRFAAAGFPTRPIGQWV